MLRPAPDLDATDLETLWWGDDAIDRDASEPMLADWCRTGDTGKLTMRPGVEPSPVKYRALTVRELSQIPTLDGSGGAMVSRCYEAARYGLVSIEGLKLQRARMHGVRGLSDAALDRLTQYRATIPVMALHSEWLAAEGIPLELTDKDKAATFAADVAQWVGGLILAATFRAGRGAP